MSKLKEALTTMWQRSVDHNLANLELLARGAVAGRSEISMCDLGCGDGELTTRIAGAVGATHVDVVEVHPPHVALAEQRGYRVTRSDLNGAIALSDATFDLVIANQVIEHLYDTEHFLDEAIRILKPGGTLIVSTENPASWHNIGALLIGWQQFSLSNVSSRRSGIGNPFSLAPAASGWVFPMQHHRLFTPRALRELLELHGLSGVRCLGAGYYPLPTSFARFDATHAALITLAARKPESGLAQLR